MTSTNRFLNRLLVLVAGLALLAVGGAIAVGVLLPDARDAVSGVASDAPSAVSSTLSSAPWIPWAAAVACLLLIVLLLWFALRQGHGRTGTLLRVDASPGRGTPTGGSVTVDAKVAEQVLTDALSRVPAIVALDVTAFRVRRQNVLRVTAHTRRGASPVAVRSEIDRAVAHWDAVLGRETPVVIQIVAGLRTRVAKAARVA
ncbi:hypothetical protein NVV95_14105 [Herbiconiux sp. CPCC 205716]|uniref:Alkaline shock response membrane anchor protein AmaP n=1 Tax=Herbiconiux gentiana TaxID=2970912 RepID=A0ABT2GK50_9MICO|nr:hypothetical protein [Herbiconiux gentiana]MCS5715680.1 hypothetical protein [Herbiconiux gentiana]